MKRVLFIVLFLLTACVSPTSTPTAPNPYIGPGEQPQPQVVKLASEYTDDNPEDYPFPKAPGGGAPGEWAISPITINLPENGVVHNVRIKAVVGFSTYAADTKVYLANSTRQVTVFDDPGHQSGCDGGADDDTACDWFINIGGDLRPEGREYPQFEGTLLNDEWQLLARSEGLTNDGMIWGWEITIWYVSGSEILVEPDHLVYYTKVEPQELKVFAATDWQALEAVVQEKQKTRVIVMTASDVMHAFSTSDHIEIERPLNTGFAATVDVEGFKELRDNPAVLNMVEDFKVYKTMKQSIPLMKADQVHTLGITGEGVSVAVLDTGIDPDHWSLRDDLLAEKCFTDGDCPPNNTDRSDHADDGDGHGTAVSGIITSRGGDTLQLGVAHDAGIIAVKVLSDNGSGWMSDIQAGIEWVTARAQQYNIKALNMSLGGGPHSNTTCDSSVPSMATAINNAKAAGISVVVASGNEYLTTGVSSPACMKNSFAVGAVYDGSGYQHACGESATKDKVICYSNASAIKPEVLAPSGKIRTTGLNGGVYAEFAGTSAAAPHAAGLVALMASANPYWTPDFIEQQIAATGKQIVDYRTGKTFPRVDALAAVTQLGLHIRNIGADPLVIDSITLENGSCWAQFDVALPLTIGALSREFIPVYTELCVGDGDYHDMFLITSNDQENPVYGVPIRFIVEGAGAIPSPTPKPTHSPTPTLEPTPTNTPEPGVTPSPTDIPVVTPTPPWCIPVSDAASIGDCK